VAELIKGPAPLKLSIDPRTFFKPFNPKFKASQFTGK